MLIDLKEMRDTTIDLKEKIAAEFKVCGFPEAEAFTEASLAQGKLLVLLDGLDEVPTQNLSWVVKHIEDFVDTYDNNSFIASCRIAAYKGLFFQRFKDVTLAEFDDEQIEQFIHRWFRSRQDLEASIADKYWELLKRDENRAAKELAQTPLLLTFLCLVYDRQQILPTKRSILYGEALDILLSEWSAQKRLERDPIYDGFYPDLEKVLLAKIAYESFEQDQLFFLKDDITERISNFLADTLDAPKYLDGAAVLRAIEQQQGILVERATNIYSFSHLTLQEYLTAFHIKEEGLERELIDQYLTDERWREVFLLASGLSDNKAINLLKSIETASLKYLVKYPKLIALIQWAERSTTYSTGNVSPIARRAAAIAIVSTINDAFTISSDIVGIITITRDSTIDIAIDIARAIDIESTIDIDDAITSAEDSVSARAHAIAIVIAIARASDSAIPNANTRAIAIDRLITRASASNIVEASVRARVIARASASKSLVLQEILHTPEMADLPGHLHRMATTIPNKHASRKDWENWASELNTLWLDTLGLSQEELIFSQSEAQALGDYLYATELLLRCKDAAIRIPKTAWADVEARLLTGADLTK